MLIDLDEIERRIPSPATECAYCYRLGTMRCLACGALACDDHRTFAVRDAIDTGCEGVAMVPAQHDAATMDRVALVAEVRRLRAIVAALVQHENSNGHAHARRALWDADNREGLRCERCARCHAFADARSVIGLSRWDVVRPSSHDEPMTAPCPADCGCAAPRYATHADAPPPWPEWARQFQMERDDARAENERLRAELATARSTIDGSPDEPTDAELSAHAGAWLARLYNGAYATMTETAARNARGVMVRGGSYAARWWALDQNERFCPRPVVTAVAATLDAGPRDADGREVTP